jgi:hypothetical protein
LWLSFGDQLARCERDADTTSTGIISKTFLPGWNDQISNQKQVLLREMRKAKKGRHKGKGEEKGKEGATAPGGIRKGKNALVPLIVSQPYIKLTCRVQRAEPRRNPSAFGSGSPRPGGARERRGGRERRGCAGSSGSKLVGRRCGSTSETRGRGRGWGGNS